MFFFCFLNEERKIDEEAGKKGQDTEYQNNQIII